MEAEFIRRCPSCGSENAPSVMRCSCGMILAGVDIGSKQFAPANEASLTEEKTASNIAPPAICPYEDCGQANPPSSPTCLYCNRPITGSVTLTRSEEMQSLVNLPAALKERYRIINPMPTRGAEAELLIVRAIAGGPRLVAKIYRHGILPKREVQDRISNIPVEHRVNVLEKGISEGYAYELMELCEHGSLRQMLDNGALAGEILQDVIHELSIALQSIHSVGLVHRDLKPENILIRSRRPLDLVLTDFSISSILDVTQRFTGVARTLPYASPESLSGVIDFKSDYWAIGMIILECAIGKHPFANLSEAVVMNYLTTRNIDLSEVSDRNVRKLLRGLLQRDPSLRWGASEVQRWLENDTSLAEPAEQGVSRGFIEPYHLASEICYKPEQLAVVLARHWKEGVADISNGQLLAWFRDVQKDQNVVRLLIDMRSKGNISQNLQLLKLILHLAPGIPPVWKGETIELPTILAYANKALKGDQEAAYWLDNLYQYRVLEVYAAGNSQAADLVKRWYLVLDQFDQTWKSKMVIITEKSAARDPDEYANYDQLVFGRNDLQQPSPVSMHAKLLALSYDKAWAESLRERILAELLNLSAQCTWVKDLGDPLQMDSASLLALEALLPEAKRSVDHQLKKTELNRKNLDKEYIALRDEIRSVLANIRTTATSQFAIPPTCEDLKRLVEQYLSLINTICASGRTDEKWLNLKFQALRSQVTANIMIETIDKLSQHRAVTAGWINLQTLRFVTLGIIWLILFQTHSISTWLIALGVAFIFISWRLLPDIWMMRNIRKLGETF